MVEELTLDTSALQDIAERFRLTPREFDRALDRGLNRGRAVAYTNALRLLAGAAEGFDQTQVRFRRRVFTEFKRPEKTIEVWEGLEPLEPDRLSIEDYRESRRLERVEGLSRRDASYGFRTPIDVAAVEAGQRVRVIEPAQEVALVEFEKVAKTIVAKAATK